MDLKMPIKDGLEATRIIRDCGYGLPIIAITAHAGSEGNNQALQAGCNDFVTKPINRETLLKTLESNGVLIKR
jgi:CheY-like chemotaxis protein